MTDNSFRDLYLYDPQPPHVAENGDVLWPLGFTQLEMKFWRGKHDLLRPGDVAPEICPRCKGTEWVCEFHPTEPWGKPGMHDDGAGAPCPVCNEAAYEEPHTLLREQWDEEWARLERGEPTLGDLQEAEKQVQLAVLKVEEMRAKIEGIPREAAN